MLRLTRPSESSIDDVIAANRGAELSYEEVGWTTRSQCPDGFSSNRWKGVIGQGESDFRAAKLAIRNYQMLQLGWLSHVGPTEPIANDSLVCTLAKQFQVYSLHVAKIVAVEDQAANRFGFSYGTTHEYPLIGEERFTVSICETTGEVAYEIFSFARPSSVATRLGWPWIRRVQQKFCIASAAAMCDACQERRDPRAQAKSSPPLEASKSEYAMR